MKLVIFVDVQNDFIDGSLGVDKHHVITNKIVEYAKECNKNGVAMYATQDTHNDNTYLSTLEGKKLPVKHCLRFGPGWQLFSELEDLVPTVFEKPTFMSYDLANAVKKISEQINVDEIELCGFCTSICVISNALALRGILPNTKISIIENLCGDINPESHKAALTVAQNCQIDIVQV